MAPHTFPRRENSATTDDILAVHIIGGSAILVVLLYLLWLLCFYRSKANKRIAEPTAALFRVRGVVRPTIAETTPSPTRPASSPDQHGLAASIVTPEISITRKPSLYGLSDKTIALSQLGPSPASSTSSLHLPLSNVSYAPPRPRAMSIPDPTCSRHSRSSSGFTGYAQYLLPPGLSSRPPSTISTSPSQVKPVRQLFRSTLPDELSLVRHGEHLTVLRSFDDGWCLVTRDTSRSSRLSAWMIGNSDNVDIGFVPAWVFIEPFRGVTVTRPFRIESINTPHLGQNPASVHTRDTIIPGSDFA